MRKDKIISESEEDKQYYLSQLYKHFDNMSSSLSSSCQTFAFAIACTIIAGIISNSIKGGQLFVALFIIFCYFLLEILQFLVSLCVSKYFIEKIYNCRSDDEMYSKNLIIRCLDQRKCIQNLTMLLLLCKISLIVISVGIVVFEVVTRY